MPEQLTAATLAPALARHEWEAVRQLLDPLVMKLAQAAGGEDWNAAHQVYVELEAREKSKAAESEAAKKSAPKSKAGKKAGTRPRPWPEGLSPTVLKKAMKDQGDTVEVAAETFGIGTPSVARWLGGGSTPQFSYWERLYAYCGLSMPASAKARAKKKTKKKAKKKKATKKKATKKVTKKAKKKPAKKKPAKKKPAKKPAKKKPAKKKPAKKKPAKKKPAKKPAKKKTAAAAAAASKAKAEKDDGPEPAAD